MAHQTSIVLSLSALLTASVCLAAEPEHGGGTHGGGRPEMHAAPEHPAEPHPGPRGYQRVTEPPGWNARPATVDRGAYQHNYQAARNYHIGPYRRPHGWVDRHWGYGEILPRAFWAPQYLIADYWLFALEVPPTGYEWVRYGNDALLIDINSGEVLQAEYGVFA
jgi:Ni/Co efflux regulator RcnB